MARRPTRNEQTLARIAAIVRDEPPTAAAELRAALGHERSLVVAQAAEAAMQLQLHALGRDLVAAFERVVRAQDDAELMAADAILKALAQLGVDAPDLYIGALRMRRMVKMLDGWVDVAAPLRAHAAKALVGTSHTSALEEVAPVLADPESAVRMAAAEALGVLGGSGAAAVLRLKLETGDEDPSVTGVCMSSLLRVDASRYLGVVADHLRGESVRLAELAALALGDSRAAGAFAALKDAVDSAPRGAMPSVLLALGLLRSDEAAAHLLDVVGRSPAQVAAQAVAALALHKHDAQMTERVRTAVASRAERAVREAFATHFER